MSLNNSSPKEIIITAIEEDRGDVAFSNDVMRVLMKVTQADLFVLQIAFNETFRLGVVKGREE